MKCKKCRRQIPDGSKFCNHCGAPVEKTKFTRRADGRYTQKLIINGKAKFFYAPSEKELMQKIAEYNAAAAFGKRFEDVAEEWEVEAEQELAYNTWRGYVSKKNRAVDYFNGQSIKSITAPDVDRYIKSFPKSWAFKTQNSYLSVLSLIFSYAQRRGYITYNPATAAKLPRGLTRNIRRAPTEEEEKIVNESIDLPGGLLAYFFLNTGLRRGEACGLQFGDIDFKNSVITVRRSVYWAPNQPEIKPPKTKAGIRQVFLSDELCLMLKKLKAQRKSKKTDIVFCDKDSEMFTNKRFAKIWKEYQDATGLSLTPHNLRHGYATMLERAGVAPLLRQKLLGHAQFSTTVDIYTHIGEGYALQAKTTVENYRKKSKSCHNAA